MTDHARTATASEIRVGISHPIIAELDRLGLAVIAAHIAGSDRVAVMVEGWPDEVAYLSDRALPVLRGYGDGHMRTEDGDAEVCDALEDADAVAEEWLARPPYDESDWEDAGDWYDSYGAHITPDPDTGHDIAHPVIGYDVAGTDEAEAAIRAEYPEESDDTIESLVAMEAGIRGAADDVMRSLAAAVTAARAGDLDATLDALSLAQRIELSHGDDPATSAARAVLVRTVS